MPTEKRFEIDDVGGIQHAELVLRPGVSLLRGVNGAGKTSAIQAVARATGGKGELERRDGSKAGTVRGPGVVLRVGGVVRRSGSEDGTAALSLADVSPLSELIDPGLKDSDAAARARIRALIRLLGVTLDDPTIDVLTAGDAESAAWLQAEIQQRGTEDVMAAAELLRGHHHALARVAESMAERQGGTEIASRIRSEAVIAELGGEAGLVDLDPEQARQALIEGSREFERLSAQAKAREDLELRQAAIGSSMGERPDPVGANESLREMREALDEMDRMIEQIHATLASAQADRARMSEGIQSAERQIQAISKARAQWDEQRAVLDQPIEGPEVGELDEIEDRLVRQREAQAVAAERSAAYRECLREMAEAREARVSAEVIAKRRRDAALEISERLGDVLEAAGAPGLTVVGGRLCAEQGGERLDFERRLSDGQRARIALDVAAGVYGGRVVPLAGAYWSSLDPENQAAFARLAEERGLYVISEEPSEGELRVEHVGDVA